MNNYKPRNTPEIYLKFLNSFNFKFEKPHIATEAHWLEIYQGTKIVTFIDGQCAEECLDFAIEQLGFMKWEGSNEKELDQNN